MPDYNAEISAGSLMPLESKRVAVLMLSNPDENAWRDAIEVQNILQKNTPATARRQAMLIRKRLMTLDAKAWEMIASRESEVVNQLLLAASMKHSLLLGDFLRNVYADRQRRLETNLSATDWQDFLSECAHHDAAVANWTDGTKAKLFQVIVRNGKGIVRLAEGERLDIELALYQQIEKYIVSPKADQATPSLKRNREALNKVPQAASALTELTQIRDTAKPYGKVNRIEPLLATVSTINEQLAQEKRERALLSIDAKIAEVQAKLTATASTPVTRNQALHPLQDLKTRVASQTSIAQILYLQGQGGDAMDEAITLIEAATAEALARPAQVAEPGDEATPVSTGASNVPLPAAKTTRVIRAADISNKKYLETEADVDVYVAKLKAELLAAVRSGQLARIQ